MRFLFIPLIFFSCSQIGNRAEDDNNSFGQIKNSQKDINLILERKIRQADTVLLVSHNLGFGDSAMIDYVEPILMEKNHIRRSIFQEQKVLNNNEKDSLLAILMMPTDNDSIAVTKCCMPHHSIFIINKDTISYIDLCFHCFCLFTSKDLSAIKGYSWQKWDSLLPFFRRLKFKYEMPDK